MLLAVAGLVKMQGAVWAIAACFLLRETARKVLLRERTDALFLLLAVVRHEGERKGLVGLGANAGPFM